MSSPDEDGLLEGFRRRMAGLEPELPTSLPEPPQADRPTGRSNPRQLRTWLVLAVSVAVLAVAVGVLFMSAPGLGPRPPAAASPTPGPSEPPTGRLTRFESVTLSADRRTVRLDFTGSKEYSQTDPCSVDYDATAEVVADTLEVAIFEVVHPEQAPLLPLQACGAIGYARSLEVQLEHPFEGHRVRDRAGFVHFLGRPEGLIDIPLPEGWVLQSERSVGGSPTGRWQRTYVRQGADGTADGAGRLTLMQGSGSPAYLEGTFEQPRVSVGGQVARLWLWPDEGEIVLVWMHGRDGLAIVANEADFTVDEVIAMAEAATPPVPVPAAVAEDVAGRFRLVFEMPNTTWQEGHPIEGWARLELRAGEPVQLGASGMGPFGFVYREVGGRRQLDPLWTADCTSEDWGMAVAAPLMSGLTRSGGFNADDPDREFYREFIERPDVQLPAGEWDITAVASFNDAWDCTGTSYRLEATIRITVVPAAEGQVEPGS